MNPDTVKALLVLVFCIGVAFGWFFFKALEIEIKGESERKEIERIQKTMVNGAGPNLSCLLSPEQVMHLHSLHEAEVSLRNQAQVILLSPYYDPELVVGRILDSVDRVSMARAALSDAD